MLTFTYIHSIIAKPEIHICNKYVGILLKIFIRHSDFCTMVF